MINYYPSKRGISVSDGLVSPASGDPTVLTSCYKISAYNGLILAWYSMPLTSVYFFHSPVAADFPSTGNDQMQAPFAASLPTAQPVIQVGAQATAQPGLAATLQAYSAQKRSGTFLCVFFLNILPHVAFYLNPFPLFANPPPPPVLDAQKSRLLVPPYLPSNLCIFLFDRSRSKHLTLSSLQRPVLSNGHISI